MWQKGVWLKPSESSNLKARFVITHKNKRAVSNLFFWDDLFLQKQRHNYLPKSSASDLNLPLIKKNKNQSSELKFTLWPHKLLITIIWLLFRLNLIAIGQEWIS